MIRFKSCAKCGGDLQVGKDMYGYYTACLQCGQYLEIEVVGPPAKSPEDQAKVASPKRKAKRKVA